jgi:transcriptional regulator with XRE-family HTH domain
MKTNFDISKFVPVLTEQTVKMELTKRFKQRRKEAGITQKMLAFKSGISYASIRRFETSGEISLSSLLRISSVIQMLDDFDALFKFPIVRNIRP